METATVRATGKAAAAVPCFYCGRLVYLGGGVDMICACPRPVKAVHPFTPRPRSLVCAVCDRGAEVHDSNGGH